MMAFDRFELTEGEYWLSQYKESAYNGLGVIYVLRLQNQFTNLIVKKLYKLKELYNIWQLFYFTEWIIDDGDSMFVI